MMTIASAVLWTLLRRALMGIVIVTIPALGAAPLVTYAGNTGTERFHDAMELSDGTVLVAGAADDLDWTSAPKHELDPLGIPDRATGRAAFVMRLAADLQSILGIWHLPTGQVENIRWLKVTSRPGEATGAIHLSGDCDKSSGDWFIARLDGNFVDAPPTGISWSLVTRTTRAHGDNHKIHAWDVGGDGRVAYAGETGETIRVFFVDARGEPLKLPALRGSHWAAEVPLDDTNRQAGTGRDLPDAVRSGISFPADLRSWTDADRLAVLPDGNGQIKAGRWPLDLFVPMQDKDGGTSGEVRYGYTGYRHAGKHRLGGIAIDRSSGAFFLGFNIQSRFWDHRANKEQPDFEPAVIAYAADGTLKWWSRLYHEAIDKDGDGEIDRGETRLSSPDQYVDGLALDYSIDPARLVVNARCHGNNTVNLWSGNQVVANPGASSFHNAFTGTEGNIHISWIGKLDIDAGTLRCATYLAGYFRNSVLSQSPYAEAIHDGWPSHNAGWPNLTTTRAEPGALRCDDRGRVYLVGIGPRMVSTSNAWQKMPKITPSRNEGIAPWAAFVRVFGPDLRSLVYSSALTGRWTYPAPGAQPVGAGNTELAGVVASDGGVIVVGHQQATDGVADGNPIPVSNVPPWGQPTPSDTSAIFARLPFDGGAAQHFNNGSGSQGDRDASTCGWEAAFGDDRPTDSSLSNDHGASTGVSQGRTDTTGVPVLGGRATRGGFLFSLPVGTPGAILLHTTDTESTTTLQIPQTTWRRDGHLPLTGLTTGRVASVSAYTRPATAGVSMRFALRVNGEWLASATSFTQDDPERWELRSLVPAAVDWIGGLWPGDMPLDGHLSNNPHVPLDPDAVIDGYGMVFETGNLAGSAARARLDSFEVFRGPPRSALETWRYRHFLSWWPHGLAADHADADDDGLTNFGEFAFGRDPRSPDPDPPLNIRHAAGLAELSFRRARHELDYVIQGSPGMQSWNDLALNPGSPEVHVAWLAPPVPDHFFRVLVRQR